MQKTHFGRKKFIKFYENICDCSKTVYVVVEQWKIAGIHRLLVKQNMEWGGNDVYNTTTNSSGLCKNIFNGTKRYEFRKEYVKPVDRILIYSTSPVMKVMGEAEIEDILVDTPEIIWERTKEKAGIDKRFFDRYYAGRNQAVAYKLKISLNIKCQKNWKIMG